MCWRGENVKNKQVGLVLTAVAAILILLTTYLALLYAPLPATGVDSANAILPSIADTGFGIRISGFVTNLTTLTPTGLDLPSIVTFALADFSDYQRYVEAVIEGNFSETWWTIRPIDVKILSGGWRPDPGPDIVGTVHNGTNISVMGNVVTKVIGPNSAISGHPLYTPVTRDVDFGPQGGF